MGLGKHQIEGSLRWPKGPWRMSRDELRRFAAGLGSRRATKNELARKRRRLWTQLGEDAPVKVRELTRGWEW